MSDLYTPWSAQELETMVTQVPSPGAVTPGPTRPLVLIVDDDAEVVETLEDVVEQQGCRAAVAGNGREALAVLDRERPSLILVDLFMPIMNGVELLKVIKKSPKLASIPRVIMTGANDGMIGVREDVSVLYKPVNLDALIRILHTHCRPASARLR